METSNKKLYDFIDYLVNVCARKFTKKDIEHCSWDDEDFKDAVSDEVLIEDEMYNGGLRFFNLLCECVYNKINETC